MRTHSTLFAVLLLCSDVLSAKISASAGDVKASLDAGTTSAVVNSQAGDDTTSAAATYSSHVNGGPHPNTPVTAHTDSSLEVPGASTSVKVTSSKASPDKSKHQQSTQATQTTQATESAPPHKSKTTVDGTTTVGKDTSVVGKATSEAGQDSSKVVGGGKPTQSKATVTSQTYDGHTTSAIAENPTSTFSYNPPPTHSSNPEGVIGQSHTHAETTAEPTEDSTVPPPASSQTVLYSTGADPTVTFSYNPGPASSAAAGESAYPPAGTTTYAGGESAPPPAGTSTYAAGQSAPPPDATSTYAAGQSAPPPPGQSTYAAGQSAPPPPGHSTYAAGHSAPPPDATSTYAAGQSAPPPTEHSTYAGGHSAPPYHSQPFSFHPAASQSYAHHGVPHSSGAAPTRSHVHHGALHSSGAAATQSGAHTTFDVSYNPHATSGRPGHQETWSQTQAHGQPAGSSTESYVPYITKALKSASEAADQSVFTLHGHTYHFGGATLNAQASSTAKSTETDKPGLASGAGSNRGLSSCSWAAFGVIVGAAALL